MDFKRDAWEGFCAYSLRSSQEYPTRRCCRKQVRHYIQSSYWSSSWYFFGKVARAPNEDVLRKLTFIPGTLRPATERYLRKVGRPRQEWAAMLLQEALRITGGYENLQLKVANQEEWRKTVHNWSTLCLTGLGLRLWLDLSIYILDIIYYVIIYNI